MAVFESNADFFNKHIKDFRKFSKTSIQKAADDTHARMTKRIFIFGQDKNGAPIGSYAAATAKIKRKKGQPTGRVVLRATNNLFLDYSNRGRTRIQGKNARVAIVRNVRGTKSRITNKELIGFLEKMFKKRIFAYTNAERANFKAIAVLEMKNILG